MTSDRIPVVGLVAVLVAALGLDGLVMAYPHETLAVLRWVGWR